MIPHPPINETLLVNTCDSICACIFADSAPAAPSNLMQNCEYNTLTSSTQTMAFANATFTWQAPNETGGIGINISHYTVDTSLESPVNTSTLSHTLTDLVVGRDHTVSVTVTATNECGLQSDPSEDVISVPAESKYKLQCLKSVHVFKTGSTGVANGCVKVRDRLYIGDAISNKTFRIHLAGLRVLMWRTRML